MLSASTQVCTYSLTLDAPPPRPGRHACMQGVRKPAGLHAHCLFYASAETGHRHCLRFVWVHSHYYSLLSYDYGPILPGGDGRFPSIKQANDYMGRYCAQHMAVHIKSQREFGTDSHKFPNLRIFGASVILMGVLMAARRHYTLYQGHLLKEVYSVIMGRGRGCGRDLKVVNISARLNLQRIRPEMRLCGSYEAELIRANWLSIRANWASIEPDEPRWFV